MRLRGLMLAVLALFVLGSYLHVPLHGGGHGHEQHHDEEHQGDCALALFCSGFGAVDGFEAIEPAFGVLPIEVLLPAVVDRPQSTAPSRIVARGPPQS